MKKVKVNHNLSAEQNLSNHIKSIEKENQDLISQVEQIEDTIKNGEYYLANDLGKAILEILGRK